jgi:hypothetical protein
MSDLKFMIKRKGLTLAELRQENEDKRRLQVALDHRLILKSLNSKIQSSQLVLSLSNDILRKKALKRSLKKYLKRKVELEKNLILLDPRNLTEKELEERILIQNRVWKILPNKSSQRLQS